MLAEPPGMERRGDYIAGLYSLANRLFASRALYKLLIRL